MYGRLPEYHFSFRTIVGIQMTYLKSESIADTDRSAPNLVAPRGPVLCRRTQISHWKM